ncbi:zinc metalloproteinase nas-4-like [Pollicipes pollicipes]|uniref:zinc metalloproteinase nas-4-like n=1 Tax=Pollicipes pollicipes TaxID=41117 RepID=UPI001884EE06|nr:zinc metalloproteinase nas-4-like [Pollicipes pollicipes]
MSRFDKKTMERGRSRLHPGVAESAIKKRLGLNSISTVARRGAVDDPANRDEFGEPLNPEDFAKALKLETALPMTPPASSEDPIEMADMFQGDIVGAPDEHPRNAINLPDEKWPRGEIPYVIASGFTSDERAVIAGAVLQFERNTCIRVRPLGPGAGTHQGYVHIVKGDGCFSSVGRKVSMGGSQQLSLGSGCVYPGIVMHEFMHAAGFWHEQSRPDRDQYITIHWDNIPVTKQYNFNKFTWDHVQNLSEPYDIGSIMHYGPKAFATNRRKPTISAKRLGEGANMGQRSGLSRIDISKLNKLYECHGVTAPPTPVVGKVECKDGNAYCKDWASSGECAKNPLYMEMHCARSCDTCPDGVCRDHNEYCSDWAGRGECAANASYMTLYCRKSCGLCPEASHGRGGACTDVSPFCQSWAGSGECKVNPDYMVTHCRKACGFC